MFSSGETVPWQVIARRVGKGKGCCTKTGVLGGVLTCCGVGVRWAISDVDPPKRQQRVQQGTRSGVGCWTQGQQQGHPPVPLQELTLDRVFWGLPPRSGADRRFLGKAGGGRGALQLGEGSCFSDPLLAPVAGAGSGGKVLCCCWGQPGWWGSLGLSRMCAAGRLTLGQSTGKGPADPPPPQQWRHFEPKQHAWSGVGSAPARSDGEGVPGGVNWETGERNCKCTQGADCVISASPNQNPWPLTLSDHDQPAVPTHGLQPAELGAQARGY